MMNYTSEEKSLPQKISEDIISLILEENLQPGDKLPNESILSKRLDAGRSSIREAMKLLASRNIVTIRQGSGTYVASSPGMVEDPLGFLFIGDKKKLVHDLLEVRFLLEPSIAAMAATHATDEDIKKITALCDDVENLLNTGNLQSIIAAVLFPFQNTKSAINTPTSVERPNWRAFKIALRPCCLSRNFRCTSFGRKGITMPSTFLIQYRCSSRQSRLFSLSFQ